jgi:hypothetical protein
LRPSTWQWSQSRPPTFAQTYWRNSGQDRSEQSFAGKRLARMRFQVTLEGEGLVFLLEGAVKLNPPWAEFGRMRATVLVMGEESLFEIRVNSI